MDSSLLCARCFGVRQKKAVFNIGHFNMEELGMRYAQDWIGDVVDHKVPVHYLPTKDIYRYIERKHL